MSILDALNQANENRKKSQSQRVKEATKKAQRDLKALTAQAKLEKAKLEDVKSLQATQQEIAKTRADIRAAKSQTGIEGTIRRGVSSIAGSGAAKSLGTSFKNAGENLWKGTKPFLENLSQGDEPVKQTKTRKTTGKTTGKSRSNNDDWPFSMKE